MISHDNYELMRGFGGQVLYRGHNHEDSHWNFGYSGAPQNDPIAAAMPAFSIVGNEEPKDHAFLWDFSLKANNGKHFLTFRQESGSCVGNGLGQAIWYLQSVEVCRNGDAEEVILPFWLLTYGKSREIAGMRGQGEGSFGSAAAEAMKREGILPSNDSSLPQPDIKDGICYGYKTEMQWSDGAKISNKYLEVSRKHIVKTAAKIKNSEEAKAALRNYYPLTCASMFGTANLVPPTKGTPPVRLAPRTDSWGHQMCCIGWLNHPELGDLFYILNSWGPDVHGKPAGSFNEPPGGFWITAKDMDFMARDEVFAFSQFDGFPAQTFSWLI